MRGHRPRVRQRSRMPLRPLDRRRRFGLDVVLGASKRCTKNSATNSRPAPILKNSYARAGSAKKTGKGVYDYSTPEVTMIFEDIVYKKTRRRRDRSPIDGAKTYNSFRKKTIDEMYDAVIDASTTTRVGVIVITGADSVLLAATRGMRDLDPQTGRAFLSEFFQAAFRLYASAQSRHRRNRRLLSGAATANRISSGDLLHRGQEKSLFGRSARWSDSIPRARGTQMLPANDSATKKRKKLFSSATNTAAEAEKIWAGSTKLVENRENWTKRSKRHATAFWR